MRFAPNSKILATGSWSGTVKLWNVPACTPIRSLRGSFELEHPFFATHDKIAGHSDRVGGVAWHPQATLSQGSALVNLASGAGDMNVHLWSLNRLTSFTSGLKFNSEDVSAAIRHCRL